MTDDLVLVELGRRLGRIRLDKNLTQSDLAREAGVALRTVQRLENGAVATQLAGFLRICRALGLAERFDLLVPEPVPSPMAQLKLQGKTRKRASGQAAKPVAKGSWQWGNES